MAAISGPNIPLDGLVFNMDPASALSYPARNDPYRDQISLVLDGASFTDKSRNNFTVTTYGNTPASPTYNQWDIGGPNNGYDQYAGITIGEVLIFNKSLTHSEMLVLLAYLNGKWGIV